MGWEGGRAGWRVARKLVLTGGPDSRKKNKSTMAGERKGGHQLECCSFLSKRLGKANREKRDEGIRCSSARIKEDQSLHK